MSLVSSVLTIYIWGGVCILLFFLFAIGRFYEQKSGRRSFYPSFFVPMALFAAAAIRYAFLAPVIIGDVWGDTLRFLGGVIVGGFGLFLLRLMIGGRS
ncbi:MAG TPA: hypothetical protein VEC96_12225 [Anaerolineae bacterium]|nr:hypothetical protein [Anaerolineae bacterium]HXV97456.1 hypothetical protein [Anaerolineae bacterium]